MMTALKDLCKEFLVPQRDKPKEFGGSIPWCRIEDIEGKYLNGTKSGQYVTEETVKKMNLKIIPEGSVICSCSASLGVQAILTTPCVTNQTFIGIVP
ncbi:MAG: restriction endonuclease subunit S, partial [Butyrivibrio sp.]|nr:restriction endonuclease subunit S [Butyrivibrio sp.]